MNTEKTEISECRIMPTLFSTGRKNGGHIPILQPGENCLIFAEVWWKISKKKQSTANLLFQEHCL